jgi:diguanylate cyclase (GGDEF)-like protein
MKVASAALADGAREPERELRDMAELALARPSLLLKFPDRLEARFEADTGAARRLSLRRLGTTAGLMYGVFLCTDVQLPQDIRPAVIFLRLVASVLLVAGFQVSTRRPLAAWAREGLNAAMLLMTSCASLAMFEIEPDSLDKAIQICSINGIIFYGVLVVPSLFRTMLFAAWATEGVVQALLLTSPLSWHARLGFGMVMVFMLTMSLITAHRMERQARRDYLRNLIESLRYANLLSDADSLRRKVERDALTGLLNRAGFDAHLQKAIDDCRQNAVPLGLILIDIDFFKSLNDRFGHIHGDECLREIARIIRAEVRGEDFVGRYGGEEFVVVLRGQDLAACTRLAERVRRAIEAAAMEAATQPGCVTASFGVASLVPGGDCLPETLFRLADRQLYIAKHGGRNQVAPAMELAPGTGVF